MIDSFCNLIFDINKIEKNHYRWIITAAHCLYETLDVFASFGIDSTGNFSIEHVQIEWDNVHFHPRHVPGLNSSHDIGWCYKNIPNIFFMFSRVMVFVENSFDSAN